MATAQSPHSASSVSVPASASAPVSTHNHNTACTKDPTSAPLIFPTGTPFDLDKDGARALLYNACDELLRKLFDEDRPPLTPIKEPTVQAALDAVRDPRLPRGPSALSAHALFKQMVDHMTASGRNPRHPGALCFVPAGGILQALVPDIVARGLLLYSAYHVGAPQLARMESDVVLWMCEAVGYPRDASFGFISTGGSQGNWAGLLLARDRRTAAQPTDLRQCVVYASEEVHISIGKGMRLAGLPESNLRKVALGERRGMCMAALRRAMEADVAAGLVPLAVIASAGSVVSGAVDDFRGIRALTDEFGCWMHVDGAYGGLFVLSREGRDILAGMELADSISLDAHKSLFVPPAVGFFLTRHVDLLCATFGHERAAYLAPPAPLDFLSGTVDIAEVSPEQTREPRGMRIWFPLKLFGADAFGEVLGEKLSLARFLAAELAAMDALELVSEPFLSILNFRVACPRSGKDAAATRERRVGSPCVCAGEGTSACRKRTVALMEFVNARRQVLIYPVTLSGLFAMRVCILSYATHKKSIDDLLDGLREGIVALNL